MPFHDGHLHGGEELAIGELREPFMRAGHADESLDMRVPGCEVGVTDRPVVAVAILAVRLEVEVTPPIHLAAPCDGAASHVPSAEPAEGGVVGR